MVKTKTSVKELLERKKTNKISTLKHVLNNIKLVLAGRAKNFKHLNYCFVGPPGFGKTSIVNSQHIVQCDKLTEDSFTKTTAKDGLPVYTVNPVFNQPVIILDELNRATPIQANLLLTFLSNRVVGDAALPCENKIAIATMNYDTQKGDSSGYDATVDLDVAMIDRFSYIDFNIIIQTEEYIDSLFKYFYKKFKVNEEAWKSFYKIYCIGEGDKGEKISPRKLEDCFNEFLYADEYIKYALEIGEEIDVSYDPEIRYEFFFTPGWAPGLNQDNPINSYDFKLKIAQLWLTSETHEENALSNEEYEKKKYENLETFFKEKFISGNYDNFFNEIDKKDTAQLEELVNSLVIEDGNVIKKFFLVTYLSDRLEETAVEECLENLKNKSDEEDDKVIQSKNPEKKKKHFEEMSKEITEIINSEKFQEKYKKMDKNILKKIDNMKRKPKVSLSISELLNKIKKNNP